MLSKAKTALLIHNANSIVTRCHSTGEVSDLEGAIKLYKIVLDRLPQNDEARIFFVNQQIGIAYWRAYYQLKYPPDLDGALHHLSVVVSSSSGPQPSAEDHFRYARALAFKHGLSMAFADLEEAARHLRRARDLLNTSDIDIPAEITALFCSVLRSYHTCTGVFDSLHESLLSIRALDISAPSTTSTLFLYAESYRSLCEWQNQSADWDQCVSLYRQSLRALPERHQDRWWYSSRLASALCAQYYFNSGDIAQHDEAMRVLITALGEWQEVDPTRSSWRFQRDRRAFLAKLDLHFGFSYAVDGKEDEYKNMDMPGKGYGYGHGVGDTKGLRISQAMYELAQALHIRYQQFRDQNDLDDALKLSRAVLNIRRQEGLGLVPMLVNLASILITRYDALPGNKDGLVEAQALCEEVLQHPKEDYACSFLARGMKGSLEVMLAPGDTADNEILSDAISLQAAALSQCPAQHCLRSIILYTQSVLSVQASASTPSRTQVLAMYDALQLIPPNSPLRLHPLMHVAILHCQIHRETGAEEEFTAAMARFDDAVNLQGAGADARLHLAMQWLTSITTESNATSSNPTTTARLFEAQRKILELLPNVASLGRDPQSRLDAAKAFQSLAQMIAVRAPDVEAAVEVLEQGRSVFWGQALRLRLPPEIERLTDPALKELAKALENEWDRKVQKEAWEVEQDHHARQTMHSMFGWKPTPIFKEERALHRRQEHVRFNQLVENARRIPGCERLMMPDQFELLRRAGDHGPVVILVASPSSCEAVMVGVCAGEQKSLRLPLPNISLAQLQFLLGSLKDAYNSSRAADRSMREARRPIFSTDDSKSSSKFKIYRVLKTLWSNVVSPVLIALDIKRSAVEDRPRIWWCPTGPFAFLPLHAAGVHQGYGPKSEIECCSDYVVSSYTPSLGTLNATRHGFDVLTAIEPRVQLIAEPAAPNQPRIPHTAAEIEAIKKLIPVQFLTGIDSKDTPLPRSSVESVLASLPATSILHLACHGRQDERAPLASGFMLSDGQLKVSQLMKLNLKRSVFAFLSACESAAGDQTQPDESIHLGAALLFAGFRSVIGTMWSMDDADGPEVAQVVYHEMFKNGTCNYGAIPYALDLAVQKLRDKGVHPSRWATYVHMGI